MMSKRIIYGLTAVAMLLTCAKDLPPPGGPADTIPPEITATTPADGDILVPLDTRLEVVFSERIDRKSALKSVFISPPLREEPRLRVKRNRLLIEPAQALDTNRTYVVTIGSATADIHGNRLRSSYTFAFSTGESIDSAQIAGIVYDKGKPKRNFPVFAFQATPGLFDSLFCLAPDYITQTGEQGEFRLQYLRQGDYLVVGVEDKDGDNRINSHSERVALPQSLTAATPPGDSVVEYGFHVTRYDSSRLVLLTGTGAEGRVTMRFTGGRIEPASLIIDSISIIDEQGMTIISDAVTVIPTEPDKVHVFSHYFRLDSSFTMQIKGLRSLTGQTTETDLVECRITIRNPDDLPPVVVDRNPQAGRSLIIVTESLTVTYSEPVLFTDHAAIIEIDSSSAITLTPIDQGGNSYAFGVDTTLPRQQLLTFSLDQRRVTDLYGNHPLDSLYQFTFTIASPESLGALTGLIQADSGEIILIQLKGLQHKLRYDLLQVGGGEFDWQLYPDKYRGQAFADKNNNRRWDLGSLSPFQFSEPGWIVADTIRIRARFEHSGYQFNFQ